MTQYPEFKLAAIQASPVYFNREESTKKACRLIEEAGSNGATLAAFGETWLPGYPSFIHVTSVGRRPWQAAAEYLANAVEVPSATTDQLCEAARRANVDVVIGIVESDSTTRGTTSKTQAILQGTGHLG
jgi:predicted amidohydrolase